MTIADVKRLLNAEILCGEEYVSKDVHTACGSDLMSDVLAFVKDQSVLLTGLCNPQVIRTAEMMDIICICFIRGKKPEENIIELAKDRGLVVMTSPLRMFEACGELYANGLSGGELLE